MQSLWPPRRARPGPARSALAAGNRGRPASGPASLRPRRAPGLAANRPGRLWRKRMFGALSIIAKVLFVLVALLIGYGLIKAKFSYHDTSLGWIEVVFVFMGIRICHITRQEKLLLDGLHVPLALVFLFRCWILSLPFFLLDRWAGLLSATIGTVVVVYLTFTGQQ